MRTHGIPPDFRGGVHLFSKKGLRGITTQVLNIFGIRVNEGQWRATFFLEDITASCTKNCIAYLFLSLWQLDSTDNYHTLILVPFLVTP